MTLYGFHFKKTKNPHQTKLLPFAKYVTPS